MRLKADTLADCFESTAALHADRWAVKTRRHAWTWQRLHAQAHAVAVQLLEAGADRRAPVALVMETGAPLLGAMMGVLQSGLFLVVIDPTHPLDRNRVIVDDSLSQFVLTDAASMDVARALHSDWRILVIPDLDADPQAVQSPIPERFEAPWPRLADDLCFLNYTSGSTGRPKGVMCDNRMVTAYGEAVRDAVQITCEDRLTLLHSPSVAGAWRQIVSAMLSGACLYPYRITQDGLHGLADLLQREQITVLHCIASVMRHFDESLNQEICFPQIRAVVFGGERVWRRDVAAARRRAGPNASVLLGLGSSEAGTVTQLLLRSDMPLESDLAPIGPVLPGKRVFILDDNGHPAPPGETGELVVASASLSQGYWRQPELTAQVFHDDPAEPGARRFRTGDLVWMSSDGMLWHAGRKDFQVKVRGFRIEIGEIEATLASHPGVKDCVVQAHPDERGEDALAAYIALRAGHALNADDLRRHLRERLPPHMIPRWFETPSPWPVTPGGKVDCRALPKPTIPQPVEAPLNHAAENGSARPLDDIEARLAVLWQQTLGRDHVGLHDDFFALGGHSLKAAQLFARIHETFGAAPPLSILMKGATIAHLATALRADRRQTRAPFLYDLKSTGSRPPLFIVHAIGGEVLSYQPLVRHLDADQPLIGVQASRFIEADGPVPPLHEIARQYVEAVRERQPHGPYYLAGYSAGGHTAYEMAQQLMVQGERVALLAIVDSIAIHRFRLGTPHPGRFFVNLYWLIRDDFVRTGAKDLGRRAYLKLSAWTRQRRQAEPGLAHPHSRIGYFFDTANLPPRWLRFMERHESAVLAHRPQSYPGRVTLLRCRARGLFSDHSHDLGWGKLAQGGVDVRLIRGNHDSILREPDVQFLARALTSALKDAPTDGGQRTERAGSAVIRSWS